MQFSRGSRAACAVACGVLFLLVGSGAISCASEVGSSDAPDGVVAVSRSALALDQTSVQPAAAYSVGLKLRTAYAGAALRVRRAANNVESDIGFNASNRVDV